jgi:glycosyltransferase involved in cell wall biosynthesis
MIESPSWAREARARTTYLFPPDILGVFSAIWIILLAGPRRIFACLKVVFHADGVKPLGKVRMLGLILVGALMSGKCRASQITHVHVHSCGDSANIALFAKLLCSIEYSLTLHCEISAFPQNQPAKWRNAKFGISIAEWILIDLNRRLGESLPKHVAVAPMGVNMEIFQRKTPYKPYDFSEPLRLFCCARLNPCKGFPFLFMAVQQLNLSGLETVLYVAGEDDVGGTGYRVDLERVVAALDITEKIIFLGAVSEEEVYANLQTAHIFALASLQEGLGVALIEALAMQLPVVATRVGGIPELITSSVDGLLVEPEDADGLSCAIRELATHPDVAAELGKRGRIRVESHFSHRLSAQRILDLLQR